jgi:two-component system KDP operon response regulator KdpE
MSEGPLVLIVDDEPPIRRFLRSALRSRGFRTVEVASAGEAIAAAIDGRPDVVLLDLGLPDRDGLEVIQELRGWSTVPIVVLSVRDREQDKVAALELGADDYVSKPFGLDELTTRLHVALRHAAGVGAADPPLVRTGGLEVDLAGHRVAIEGVEVHLTPTEFELLAFLARHIGKVVTHRQLLRAVWGPEYGAENHYVRVFMAQLRQKLEKEAARPHYIRTETGVGYRLMLYEP